MRCTPNKKRHPEKYTRLLLAKGADGRPLLSQHRVSPSFVLGFSIPCDDLSPLSTACVNLSLFKWNEMNRALGHLCAHIGSTGPGEPPEEGEMIEMTLSSRHRIRNSSLGGLRSSTLPLGHESSPQYWLYLCSEWQCIHTCQANSQFSKQMSCEPSWILKVD